MIINIKAKKDRQNTAEQPSKKGCGSSHGSDQESMFRKALNDALKKCKLMKTYDEALPKWHMATSLVQQMGCPYELVERYENQLMAHFLKMREKESKRYIDIFHDNHGEINH